MKTSTKSHRKANAFQQIKIFVFSLLTFHLKQGFVLYFEDTRIKGTVTD